MRTVVSVILAGLASHVCREIQQRKERNISLLGGDVGNIMFLYYYSRIDSKYEEIADDLLGEILKISNHSVYSYCNGLAGFGKMMTLLERDGFIVGAINALEEYDMLLQIELKNELQSNRHDFLHGFIGLGFYFLERYKSGYKNNVRPLLEIVDYLYKTAEYTSKGVRWKLEDKYNRIYNISLSHGMSSTIILLCQILNTVSLDKNYKSKIKELVKKASDYILCQKQNPKTNISYFPSTSMDCQNNSYSRLGWCYGDLGVAICLLNVGRALNDTKIFEFAVGVLIHNATVRRNLVENQIYDACICHGTSGIALIFDVLFNKTGIKEFGDASVYWRQITIEKAIATNDGYTYEYLKGNGKGYAERNCILDGSSGIGLWFMGVENSPLANVLLINY